MGGLLDARYLFGGLIGFNAIAGCSGTDDGGATEASMENTEDRKNLLLAERAALHLSVLLLQGRSPLPSGGNLGAQTTEYIFHPSTTGNSRFFMHLAN